MSRPPARPAGPRAGHPAGRRPPAGRPAGSSAVRLLVGAGAWAAAAVGLAPAAAADGPAPWVAVRAPRTAGERVAVAEALTWWDGPAAPAAAVAAAPASVAPVPPAETGAAVVQVAAAVPALPPPAAPAPRLAWWAEPLRDGAADDAEADGDAAGADADENDADENDADDPQARLDAADPKLGQLSCEALPCLFTPLREISVGLNTPTAVLADTVRTETVRSAAGTCERKVPVSYKTVEPPPGAVDECFLLAGARDATPYRTRVKPLAMEFCFSHRPLYFEDANLERCGNSQGPHVQPFVSAGHFFGTVPLLPWWIATRPPHECVPATPFCPPCGEYDVVDNFLPPTDPASLRRGAVAEGAAATALFLIFP